MPFVLDGSCWRVNEAVTSSDAVQHMLQQFDVGTYLYGVAGRQSIINELYIVGRRFSSLQVRFETDNTRALYNLATGLSLHPTNGDTFAMVDRPTFTRPPVGEEPDEVTEFRVHDLGPRRGMVWGGVSNEPYLLLGRYRGSTYSNDARPAVICLGRYGDHRIWSSANYRLYYPNSRVCFQLSVDASTLLGPTPEEGPAVSYTEPTEAVVADSPIGAWGPINSTMEYLQTPIMPDVWPSGGPPEDAWMGGQEESGAYRDCVCSICTRLRSEHSRRLMDYDPYDEY